MKTRGIQNAINRLKGARKFGSMTLLTQAENEAQHILTQAKAWLKRSSALHDGVENERYAEVNLAVIELEQTIAQVTVG